MGLALTHFKISCVNLTMKMDKKYYLEYFLHTPFNYTRTNLADHSE